MKSGAPSQLLGSARASRAGRGASPRPIPSWESEDCSRPFFRDKPAVEKVRAGEGASASTRDACAPQTLASTPQREVLTFICYIALSANEFLVRID
ncbi:MAG: hypothetical protein DMF23_15260 [Verrucomicrobia bacterium]|nr:MAG: hypothetical protein DMF23_15260 [Verrucomicrobiota bacterium]